MAKLIAYYLPQYHPTKENDKWWGPGFTDWRSVNTAKPLFRGHVQPKIPADLGYYDLRLEDTRIQQGNMAQEYGIDAFCYWHYWFGGGKRLLNYPFDEVLRSGKPDIPFCLGWANHSWYKKAWGGKGKDELLIEQTYPGETDYILHFNTMLPAFRDARYFRHNGKLLFFVYKPLASEQMKLFISTWRRLASENGLGDFFFVGEDSYSRNKKEILSYGYDAICNNNVFGVLHRETIISKALRWVRLKLWGIPMIFEYKEAIKYMITAEESKEDVIPLIVPNWDHSPRSGATFPIFVNSKPKYFESLVRHACMMADKKENDLIIVKSWNEWGEGNYLEPDMQYGRGMLEALRAGKRGLSLHGDYVHKVIGYFNMAAHYNSLFYQKMDSQLHCDFVFGEKEEDIKEMDLSLLKGYKMTAPRHKYFGGRFWTEHGVFRLIKKGGYDTILLNPVTKCLTVWRVVLWAKCHNKKVVYYGHGYYGKESKLQTFVKRIVFSWCDAFLLYGEYAKNLMIKNKVMPAEKMYPIYNSLDYDKQLIQRNEATEEPIYQKHFGNNNKNLFFIGRLTPVKKLDMLIDAINALHKKRSDYNLTFIGGGTEEAALKEKTQKLGLNNVWFYGPCYDEKILGQLIYNADLCVAPGNIGLTAMHAMMYGTPVLSHNNFKWQGPEFEAIEDGLTGCFFEQNNVNSMCDAIVNWFTTHNDRAAIRKECYRVMDTKYNTNVQIKIIQQSIEDIWQHSQTRKS